MFTITYFLLLPGVVKGILSNTTVTVLSAATTAVLIAVSNAARAFTKVIRK